MQLVLPALKQVYPPRLADLELIARLPTFRSSLRHGVNESGLTQDELAENAAIERAGVSRMVCEPRHKEARPRQWPHEKLAAFCLITGTYAPIQWHAFQLGCAVVPLRDIGAQNIIGQYAAERAREYMQIRVGAA